MQNGASVTLCAGRSNGKSPGSSEPMKNLPPGILIMPAAQVGSGSAAEADATADADALADATGTGAAACFFITKSAAPAPTTTTAARTPRPMASPAPPLGAAVVTPGALPVIGFA